MKKLVAYALVFAVCFSCSASLLAGDTDWPQPVQQQPAAPQPTPPPPSGEGNSIVPGDTTVPDDGDLVGALLGVVSPNIYVQIALESLIP